MYYGYGCINGCERKHPDSPLYDNIDIDHIVPVKLGGGGCWLSNYQPLCKPCHKTKTVADFNWKMPKLRKEDDSPFEQLTMAWAP